eukprot:CAMPEP_0113399910 /NCGR_PEP_ID=MMETSP0013_2-20120614/15815_1 /TAXON_ID=2843 ORGANISM="Skeletonema costatum, Strain 1716" /NCGR_SAMPLE_ID=MMETSP0013_2 /ASSEMBLY_ACC=CAM_ASM_000158 /LENGTH=531 /DNA_ID=CAMNT_0000284891 /DNA_START=11 /DNA_END=1606 /DNA_ORIENTATION=- /assembly_acc=CAM_ASM_000158
MASILFSAWALLLLLCHVIPTASKSRSDAYDMLAASIRRNELSDYDIKTISSALKGLSTTQAALKRIDGTAHEMYQRTHKSSTTLEGDDDDDEDSSGKIGGLKVKGRMSRNAARVGCVADALFAAELCELSASVPSSVIVNHDETEDGTLADWTEREIVFNATIYPDESTNNKQSNVALSVLVIYEPKYNGGAGVRHGGIEDLLSFAQEEADDDSDSAESNSSTQSTSSQRGRFIIILSDHDASSSKNDLPYIISTLDVPPIRVKLNRQSNEMASVSEPLYRLAGTLIRSVGQVIDLNDKKEEVSDNEIDSEATNDTHMQPSDRPAIHIVGHSLSGAVGALAANILDGRLPMPSSEETSATRWSGFARDRVSALCLGCPPCMSGIEVDFVTSVINGDDIVPRSSYRTLQRLYGRTERSIKGGILGKGVGWMSDAARLTVTGLTSGSSKKKDAHLAVPGRVYLIRPRRIGGGSSSIHEVGGSIGGRENFRAAVLWQLNDVLLSKSLWKHHSQSSYIRSLDRVQLKGFSDDTD